MRFPLLLPLACALALFCARPALAQSATLTGRPWPPTDAQPALPTVQAVQAGAPLAAGAAPAQVAPGESNWVHDWTRMVFQSRRDGNWELYSARGDGTDAARLTQTRRDEARPRISPDGTREIWLMNADGGNAYALVASPGSDYAPAWSPDGARLAFVTTRNGSADVYEVELGTGALRVIAATPLADFDPAYNPERAELYWVRQVDESQGTIQALAQTPDGPVERSLVSNLRYPQRLAVRRTGEMVAYNADVTGDGLLDIDQVHVLGWTSDQDHIAGYGSALPGGLPTFYEPYLDAYPPVQGGAWRWVQYTQAEWQTTAQGSLQLARLEVRRVTFYSSLPYGETVVGGGFDAFADWVSADHAPPTAFIYRPEPLLPIGPGRPGVWPTVIGDDGGGMGGLRAGSSFNRCQVEYSAGDLHKDVEYTLIDECDIGILPAEEWVCRPIAVRARVADAAVNWSRWAKTTLLFTHKVARGRLTDVRGQGVPGITVGGAFAAPAGPPLATDAFGNFAGPTCAESVALTFAVPSAFQPLPQYNFGYGVEPPDPVALLPARGVVWHDAFDYGDVPFLYAWKVGEQVGIMASDRDARWAGRAGSSLLVLGWDDVGIEGEPLHLWARSRPRAPLAPAAEQHDLTLAFDLGVVLNGVPHPAVPFTVSVQTSAWPTVTAVYTETLREQGWANRWAPLGLPVGDAMTLTVEALVPVGARMPAIYVDNIAIASWWSPRVTRMSSAEVGAGLVLTLIGENLTAPLVVEAGGVRGTAEVLEDGTLRVTFPTRPPPGLHAVAVTNRSDTPDAVTAIAPQALLLGRPLWLPAVSRWIE